MLILRNKNGAFVEEFSNLKELKDYIKNKKLNENDYIIVDKS